MQSFHRSLAAAILLTLFGLQPSSGALAEWTDGGTLEVSYTVASALHDAGLHRDLPAQLVAYRDGRGIETALEDAKDAALADPLDPRISSDTFDFVVRDLEIERKVEAVNDLVAAFPQEPLFHKLRGDLLTLDHNRLLSSRYRAGLESYREALRLDPSDPFHVAEELAYHDVVGMGLVASRPLVDRAESFLREYPNSRHVPEVRLRRATALMDLGSEELARGGLMSVVRLHPMSPEAATAGRLLAGRR